MGFSEQEYWSGLLFSSPRDLPDPGIQPASLASPAWLVDSFTSEPLASLIEYWSGLPCPPPGDFPNPGTEPRSPTLQVDSLPSEPQGSPRILEWLAYPFSRGPSQPTNWTRVSCVASRFFTSWATRETQKYLESMENGSFYIKKQLLLVIKFRWSWLKGAVYTEVYTEELQNILSPRRISDFLG